MKLDHKNESHFILWTHNKCNGNEDYKRPEGNWPENHCGLKTTCSYSQNNTNSNSHIGQLLPFRQSHCD